MGFQHPWEIRAFAMAVTAHRQLTFDWAEFQKCLIVSIQDWEINADTGEIPWSYYQHWVTALEAVLANAGLLKQADLDVQTDGVLALPPNRNHHEAHTEPIAIDPAHPVSA
jgi:nitrile hydratase accessory protein